MRSAFVRFEQSACPSERAGGWIDTCTLTEAGWQAVTLVLTRLIPIGSARLA